METTGPIPKPLVIGGVAMMQEADISGEFPCSQIMLARAALCQRVGERFIEAAEDVGRIKALCSSETAKLWWGKGVTIMHSYLGSKAIVTNPEFHFEMGDATGVIDESVPYGIVRYGIYA